MKRPCFARIRLIVAAVCFSFFFQSAQATPTITVTDDDGVSLSTRKNRGDTVTYTNVVTNTSSTEAAANVIVTIPTPANATDVPGAVHASPVAFDDAYTTVGNTKLYIGITPAAGEPAVTYAAPGLLANDTIATAPDVIVLTAFTNATASGGTVVVNANGTFAYTPPVNFTGIDSFTYTIGNSAVAGLTGSGTVKVTVSNRVWYVNNAVANGDGRSSSPFNSLGFVNGSSSTNDYVYVFTGSGNYTAGITLKNGQTLIGAGVALAVGTNNIAAAGSRPTVFTTTGSVAVALASGNTIQGLNVNSSGSGIAAISGASVGTLLITNAAVGATGGKALNLGNGNMTVALDSLSSTNSIDSAIVLNAMSGTLTANAGSISGASGTDVLITGGSATITYPGNISNSSGKSIDIGTITGGTITFSGTITENAQGINIHNCTGGIINFSGGTKTFNTAANNAVTLTSNSGATINFSNGGLNITTTTGNAFTATGGGTVNVTTGANPNSISTGAGGGLNISGTTIGASGVTFRSISSNGGSLPGINLDSTGSGFFTVTGDGTTAVNASGGTIQNKSGGSDGTDGIYLNNASNITLRQMLVKSNTRNGILAQSINGLTLLYCEDRSNADQLTPSESNLRMVGMTGSLNVTNSIFADSYEQNVELENSSGTATLNLTGCTITNSGASGQAGNMVTVSVSGGNTTLNLQDSTLTGNQTTGFNTAGGLVATTSAGTLNVNVFRNTFQNHNVAVEVSTATSGILNFDISNNGGSGNSANNGTAFGKITGSDSIGVSVFMNADSMGSATGFIRGNTIGTQGTTSSGSRVGRGIQIQNEGCINSSITVSGNIVQEIGLADHTAGNEAINIQHGISVAGVAGATRVTVTGNTIRDVRASRALVAQILNTGSLCTSISGNALSNIYGQGGTASKLRVRQAAGTYTVTQKTPTSATDSLELDDANGLSFAAGEVTVTGIITFNGGTCP